MTQQHSLVFFGNERLATGVKTECWTLRQLLKEGYKIHAVVVNNDTARSRKERKLEITEMAATHNIPVLQPKNPTDISSELRSYGATAAVLVAYGRIIPESVINIFPKGIINLHPSMLPLHRGPTPIESTILAGEQETGISIMRLVKEMDAGPVYVQKKQHISPDRSSKQDLANHFGLEGARLLLDTLPAILDGSLVATPQDHSKATYDNLITQVNGIIDWQKDAKTLTREITAYAGWPRSKTNLGGIDITVTEAKLLDTVIVPGKIITESNELIIGCKKGALKIEKLIPAGKKEMPANAFLAGYKSKLC
jgi:methionyl-tRNA formyltransferase